MYGITELKPDLKVTDIKVSCPVLECRQEVKRQRHSFTRHPDFRCPDHGIFISPSTFEYTSDKDNILWDFDLLAGHKGSKRESRIARDNSEDALTWNIFRFLERRELLIPYLSGMAGMPIKRADVIYWSHHRETGKPWATLWEARKIFERDPSKGSEPDLIVVTDKVLFLIEAKLMATNKTPSKKVLDPTPYKKAYTSGGDGWFAKVFRMEGTADEAFACISFKDRLYELMRFWLLGTWMAKKLNLNFRLVNLVCGANETDIVQRFGRHIVRDSSRDFMRLTWEEIYSFIKAEAPAGGEKDMAMKYMEQKSTGYGADRKIRKAFIV